MKKQIIAGIAVIACATVWPSSAEVEDFPTELVNTAGIEPRSEKISEILLSVDSPATQEEFVAVIESLETEITAEEKTELASPTEPTSPAVTKSAPAFTEPRPGTLAVIDGNRCLWVPGFGWVKDEGGGSICSTVDGEGNINKQVGVMGGGTMVGHSGDELTGNKVGIMGGGTVAKDMYENGHKIGIMGSEESVLHETTSPTTEQPGL